VIKVSFIGILLTQNKGLSLIYPGHPKEAKSHTIDTIAAKSGQLNPQATVALDHIEVQTF